MSPHVHFLFGAVIGFLLGAVAVSVRQLFAGWKRGRTL